MKKKLEKENIQKMLVNAEYYRVCGEKMLGLSFQEEKYKIVYRDIFADYKKNPKCNLEHIARYLGYTKCLDGKNNSQVLKIIYKKLYKKRKVNVRNKLKRIKNKTNAKRKSRKNRK